MTKDRGSIIEELKGDNGFWIYQPTDGTPVRISSYAVATQGAREEARRDLFRSLMETP